MAQFQVVEKFVSINGEARRAGELAVFIRFKGCNLQCAYCDTKWANQKDAPFTIMTEDEIYDYIHETGLLYDKELYEIFKNNSQELLDRKEDVVYKVIQKCSSAKAKVVEEDFTEKNVRMFLNLGHTFGHALETIAGLGNITHGDAVAWGIGRCVSLCANEEFCTEAFKREVQEILEKFGWCAEGIPSIVTGGGIGERLPT